MTRILRVLMVTVGSIGLGACQVDLMTAVLGPGKLAVDPPPGRRLLDVGFTGWQWSPDGKSIVYSAVSTNSYDLQARFEAVDVEAGTKRVLVSAAPNESYANAGFTVGGTSLYFAVTAYPSSVRSIYRAHLDGTGSREKAVDTIPYSSSLPWPSPDERLVAWIEWPPAAYAIVVVDLATKSRERYPLQRFADRVTWSPDQQTLIADDSHSLIGPWMLYQIVDRSTRKITSWNPPTTMPASSGPITGRVGWVGGNPMLYTVEPSAIARYAIGATTREVLAAVDPDSRVGAWTTGFTHVVVNSSRCLRAGRGFQGCDGFSNHLELLNLVTGEREDLLKQTNAGPIIGEISPDGEWMVFDYLKCGYGCNAAESGLYAIALRNRQLHSR